MGIINKSNALAIATSIDNSGLKQDAEEAQIKLEKKQKVWKGE